MKIEIDINNAQLKKFSEMFSDADKSIKTDLLRIMKKSADFVEGEAVKRTPVFTGALQSSFKAEAEEKSGDLIGRVYIPPNMPAAGYAIKMHEAFYNLGEISQQKQRAVDVKVGRKYLERALRDSEKNIQAFFQKEFANYFSNIKKHEG